LLVAFLEPLVCAMLFGMAIGLERQVRRNAAGLRTNTLVSMGAALFVLIGPLTGSDASRIEAQIVSGIGFIGGGAILREGLTIRGVSTAATLWCSAAVGSLCGAGKLKEAGLAAAVILAINVGLRPISHRLSGELEGLANAETHYLLQFTCDNNDELRLRKLLVTSVAEMELILRSVRSDPSYQAGIVKLSAVAVSIKKNDHAVERVVAALSSDPAVQNVNWEIVHEGTEHD
jgi:putative Mg2+ transporter-C (MgtC) family protein